MSLHVVKAAVVKVSIGSASGNRVAHIARRGDVLPAGVDEAQLKDLAKRGLIEKVAEAASEKQEAPNGTSQAAATGAKAEAPSEKWTNEQLAAFADEHSIDISSAGKKAEAVEILTAELAKREAAGQQAQ